MLATLTDWLWTYVLIAILLLVGLRFTLASRFVQIRLFTAMFAQLRVSRSADAVRGISGFQALLVSVAGRVGGGNIAGVAVAITLGGPGALFWMWVTAFVGMASNFFTSTLSVMYRGKDSEGEIQGGPMYVIREALSKNWYPLAVIFSICCMVGCLPIFQANQLTQAIIDIGFSSSLTSTFYLGGDSS